MFSKRRREDQLQANGIRAPGVVVERRGSHIGRQSQGYDMYGAIDQELVHVKVRVEPEGDAPFEVSSWLWSSERLDPGATVSVLYDPADHGNFSIENAAGGLLAEASELLGGEGGLEGLVTGRHPGEVLGPDAVREALDLGSRQPDPSPAQPEVAPQPQSWTPFPAQPAPAPPAAPDPVDQLAKLAKLRDGGVLTDAEFEEAKGKLLSDL